jgi:hypothetical protein
VRELIVTIAGSVVALAGALGAIAAGGRWMLRTLRRVNEFLEDWNGEPPRAGVAERPGVMERLARIEAELRPNGGSSMRDEIRAIRDATTADPPPPTT